MENGSAVSTIRGEFACGMPEMDCVMDAVVRVHVLCSVVQEEVLFVNRSAEIRSL